MQVSSIQNATDARRMAAARTSSVDGATPAVKAADKRNQTSVAARQFEAIILRQLLSPTIEPLMAGGITGGKGAMTGGGGGMYGYMMTDVLANSLSQGNGLGLAKVLEKQLTPKGAALPAKVAASYRSANTIHHE
jgi:flagellar protein FlgJ